MHQITVSRFDQSPRILVSSSPDPLTCRAIGELAMWPFGIVPDELVSTYDSHNNEWTYTDENGTQFARIYL